MAALYIHNFTRADFDELVAWARIGANNCMIGENTETTEIPNHGRLIDGDRAEKELAFDYAYAAAKMVREMPTVIPASGGERP